MGESIVIASGKGGVGKTVLTAYIGAGLAQLEKRVLVIDTDLGLRNLDVVLGLENQVLYNLVDVIHGVCRPEDAWIQDGQCEHLYLLPAAQTKEQSSVSPSQIHDLVQKLKECFDYILLDGPSGIEQGFQNAVAGGDRVIVVTTPEVSAVRDADRVIGLLHAQKVRDVTLLINRIRTDLVRRGDMMPVDTVTDLLPVPLLGVIPDDDQVMVAANRGTPALALESSVGKAYYNICRRITGEEIPFSDLNSSRGFFSRISSALRKNER